MRVSSSSRRLLKQGIRSLLEAGARERHSVGEGRNRRVQRKKGAMITERTTAIVLGITSDKDYLLSCLLVLIFFMGICIKKWHLAQYLGAIFRSRNRSGNQRRRGDPSFLGNDEKRRKTDQGSRYKDYVDWILIRAWLEEKEATKKRMTANKQRDPPHPLRPAPSLCL